MKLFTVEEANALLPDLALKLERIRSQYVRLAAYREPANAAAIASEFGGGMQGGTRYVRVLYDVGKLTTELHELGVQLKDHSRGLIDFPSMRDGRVVLLCWQLGEPVEISWWHEVEAGFGGRKPL